MWTLSRTCALRYIIFFNLLRRNLVAPNNATLFVITEGSSDESLLDEPESKSEHSQRLDMLLRSFDLHPAATFVFHEKLSEQRGVQDLSFARARGRESSTNEAPHRSL
jgi:hypothetical protein